MEHKSAVVREAEEIIANYIKKQTALSHRFRIKKKRNHPKGLFLLFGIGVAVIFWVVFFLLIL